MGIFCAGCMHFLVVVDLQLLQAHWWVGLAQGDWLRDLAMITIDTLLGRASSQPSCLQVLVVTVVGCTGLASSTYACEVQLYLQGWPTACLV